VLSVGFPTCVQLLIRLLLRSVAKFEAFDRPASDSLLPSLKPLIGLLLIPRRPMDFLEGPALPAAIITELLS
jgi:hypothetical protein